MSQAIVNAPIIVFAGAGASAHLGYPTAAEFMKHLAKKAAVVDLGTLRPLWDHVLKSFDGPCDFEDVYDRLDTICSLEWQKVLFRHTPMPSAEGIPDM